jgi:hypothetical protein
VVITGLNPYWHASVARRLETLGASRCVWVLEHGNATVTLRT